MRALLHSGGPLGPEGRAGLAAYFQGAGPVAFVTAASLHDPDVYFERIRAALAPPPPEGAGLDMRLRESGLLPAIRDRVLAGMPYAGASAGSNVAGPTILTTNDWNVVALARFDALGLVPFNINPHYKEMDPAMAAFSETRDDRIREYHVVNANPVLGLEEGAWVVVEDGVTSTAGTARVKLFRRGMEPVWHAPGSTIAF
jgi:dipeptidase E